jgi:hypothetical protein
MQAVAIYYGRAPRALERGAKDAKLAMREGKHEATWRKFLREAAPDVCSKSLKIPVRLRNTGVKSVRGYKEKPVTRSYTIYAHTMSRDPAPNTPSSLK